MDLRYFAILVIAIVLIIGYVQTRSEYKDLRKRKDLIVEFGNKFNEFCKQSEFDNQLYFWLVQNSVLVQSELGSFGIVAYKPPSANYMIPNYQVIVNLIPELRREKTDNSMFRDMAIYHEHANLCLEVLIRYLGLLEKWLGEATIELRNPFIWLRNGVQAVLLIPLYLLNWFGVLGKSTIGKFTQNIFFKSISAIVAIIGLLSSLVTIIIGWDEFSKLISIVIKMYFNRT